MPHRPGGRTPSLTKNLVAFRWVTRAQTRSTGPRGRRAAGPGVFPRTNARPRERKRLRSAPSARRLGRLSAISPSRLSPLHEPREGAERAGSAAPNVTRAGSAAQRPQTAEPPRSQQRPRTCGGGAGPSVLAAAGARGPPPCPGRLVHAAGSRASPARFAPSPAAPAPCPCPAPRSGQRPHLRRTLPRLPARCARSRQPLPGAARSSSSLSRRSTGSARRLRGREPGGLRGGSDIAPLLPPPGRCSRPEGRAQRSRTARPGPAPAAAGVPVPPGPVPVPPGPAAAPCGAPPAPGAVRCRWPEGSGGALAPRREAERCRGQKPPRAAGRAGVGRGAAPLWRERGRAGRWGEPKREAGSRQEALGPAAALPASRSGPGSRGPGGGRSCR